MSDQAHQRSPLPLLPGNQYNFKISDNYRKSHIFDLHQQQQLVRDDKPAIGGQAAMQTATANVQQPIRRSGALLKRLNAKLHADDKNTSSKRDDILSGGNKNIPAWLAFDKQVLHFSAYFEEEAVQSREETFRIRDCDLYYFLEDDTMQVMERRQDNSGMPQGCIVRRQRIPLPSDCAKACGSPSLLHHHTLDSLHSHDKSRKCDRDCRKECCRDRGEEKSNKQCPADCKQRCCVLAGNSISCCKECCQCDAAQSPTRHGRGSQTCACPSRANCKACQQKKSGLFANTNLSTYKAHFKQPLDNAQESVDREQHQQHQHASLTRQQIEEHDEDPSVHVASDAQLAIFSDLRIGERFAVFGKPMMLYACDAYTRRVYDLLDLSQPANFTAPSDQYTQVRQELKSRMKPIRGSSNHAAGSGQGSALLQQDCHDSSIAGRFEFKKFLQNDGKVLQFVCIWNNYDDYLNRDDYKIFTLNYHLADDTIDIVEQITYQGLDHGLNEASNVSTVQFLKRGRLPKEFNTQSRMTDIGAARGDGGASSNSNNTSSSNDKSGASSQQQSSSNGNDRFWRDCDLQLGATVNVYGRDFLLVDCSAFTMDYYKRVYKLDMSKRRIDVKPLQQREKAKQDGFAKNRQHYSTHAPPYTGYGSYEDSLGSWTSLIPQQPRKDFQKMVQYDGVIFRFEARLANNSETDADRRFMIAYYLADDTLAIFELNERNSGFVGGKFLERRRVERGKQDTSQPPVCYLPHDFYEGAIVSIYDHVFEILRADEYTLAMMEKQPERYPKSDLAKIKRKLEPCKNALVDHVNRNVSLSELQQLFQHWSHVHHFEISPHEIHTLARKVTDRHHNNLVDIKQLLIDW